MSLQLRVLQLIMFVKWLCSMESVMKSRYSLVSFFYPFVY